MGSRKNQVKLEEKELVLEFELAKIQFNKSASYFLEISLNHGHRTDLLSLVTLEINHSGIAENISSVKTDQVIWDGMAQSVTFETKHFKFIFPKGFCKNDKNYDVHLQIQAYSCAPGTDPIKMGDAVFAIYPRTETPKANLNVKIGEDFYRYSGILTLLRPMSKSSISMHCGRLTYAVALYEYIAIDKSDDFSGTLTPVPKLNLPASPLPLNSPMQVPLQSPISPQQNEPTDDAPITPVQKISSSSIKSQLKEDKARNLRALNNRMEIDEQQQLYELKQPTALSSDETIDFNESFHISVASTPLPDNKNMEQSTSNALPVNRNVLQQNTNSPSNNGLSSAPGLNHYVARPGHEEICVLVHGATSLPSRLDGGDPQPFVSLKSSYEEKGGRAAQCVTKASLQPTHSPIWEEVMALELPESSKEKEIILTISDSASKEKLINYSLDVADLLPFHPYHFELVQPTSSIPAGIRLYTTVVRKLSYLPRLEGFGFCGLEVTLRDFQHELKNPEGTLIAVARIVPDYTAYKDKMLSNKNKGAGINTTTVTFPSPNSSSFKVNKNQQQGHPQVTLPSKDETKPYWNHSFMFCSDHEIATMFSHNSALVIEYYPTYTTMSSLTWSVRNPVGFSTLLLNEDVYSALSSNSGKMGVRVDDLIIQGTHFKTVDGPFPSVRLIIRFINTERPDTLTVVSDAMVLPNLDSIANDTEMPTRPRDFNPNRVAEQYLTAQVDFDTLKKDETAVGGPPFNRKKTRLLVKDDEFPPSDALESLFPDYVLTENDIQSSGTHTQNTQLRNSNPSHKVMEGHQKTVLDHQANELDNYREAVKRMSNDIVNFHKTIAQLQEENALLRRELLVNREMGKTVMEDLHKGVISSGEVADKFVAVRQQLARDTGDLKKYKSKVQNLQNEVIKANEREKKYLQTTPSRKELENNNNQLQEKLKKTKKLEDTCRQQDKVIQKMEKLLNKYMKQSNSVNASTDNQLASNDNNLILENQKLRIEMERVRMEQQSYSSEKADLLARLERAENRVVSLESQLDHNARTWARDKHELTVRLQEHRNGIVRTTAQPSDLELTGLQ